MIKHADPDLEFVFPILTMAFERMRARLAQDEALYPTNLPSQTDRRFGTRGIAVGTVFRDRQELLDLGHHGRRTAGIYGSVDLGAFSVVVSGGYADDRDEGEFIEYTGAGGQDGSGFSGSGIQVEDQDFQHSDNRAMQKSVETKRPIRVFRGPKASPKYAPDAGYRFDGMYIVEKAFYDKGVHGYRVCKFHLRRVPGQPALIKNY
ncbi:putative SAD/SRA domain containing protein [Lyophyllum shimeji]|uniref:SAD/SRA domain containing protein n=1 Tax=Lyophyllum shimeji TaxID=47721 RepID=A0A9P3USS8_LYOSH|nr:putative SAD/SRA domain containing protein [Lyophyllum shimeji]